MNESSGLNELTIGFIGGGNMARAIASPLLMKKIIVPDKVRMSAKTLETRQHWKKIYGVHTTDENSDIVRLCDIIFLAIKPQCLDDTIKQAFNTIQNIKNKLFVSIVAGVTLDTLQNIMAKYGYPVKVKIIRTMPNMPLSVRHGITLYSCNEHVNHKETLAVVEMFSHLGMVEKIDESLIDSAGGLTGCGPAFAYLIIEALADGAVKNGVPRALATKFAAQILIGAGKMVIETGKHPGELKDEVCSPGGTTIAGIHQLEIGSIRASLINAVDAAANRSKELGSKDPES